METVSNRPDVRLNFLMEPGDLLFVNNCLILHTELKIQTIRRSATSCGYGCVKTTDLLPKA